MNYVITTCSQQIYTRIHLRLYQEHTPVICLAFGVIALSNESGISDQWLPTELRRKAVDGKFLL